MSNGTQTTTATEVAFDLTPPDPVPVVAAEKAAGLVPVAPEVKEAYQRLLDHGWTDAVRTLHPDERVFTFWDYFRNAFPRDAGLRIDHFLLNRPAAERLRQAGVDRSVRALPKTSDHAPVWIELGRRRQQR